MDIAGGLVGEYAEYIKRLTDLCVERGITTNKLATLSGITQSTLNTLNTICSELEKENPQKNLLKTTIREDLKCILSISLENYKGVPNYYMLCAK